MSCEILAEVTIKGLVFLGENEIAGTYICSATTVNPYTTSISPYVCTGVMSAAKFGQILKNSEAAQATTNEAINKSCGLAVELSEDAVKIIAFKAKETHSQIKRNITQTTQTFSALNSIEGLNWLMRYLSR